MQYLLERSMNPLMKSQDHLDRDICNPSCGWECIPQEAQSKIYKLLDVNHPLGRDYRAMAEALGFSQDEVRKIEQHQQRDMFISAAIVKVSTILKLLIHVWMDK